MIQGCVAPAPLENPSVLGPHYFDDMINMEQTNLHILLQVRSITGIWCRERDAELYLPSSLFNALTPASLLAQI